MQGAHFPTNEEVDHEEDPDRATAMLHAIQQNVKKNFWEDSESEDWSDSDNEAIC